MDIVLVMIIVMVVVIGIVAILFMKSRKTKSAPLSRQDSAAQGGPSGEKAIRTQENKSGLKIETLRSGKGGAEAKWGNQVSMHYTGWLTNGQKFDSSHDRGTPFQFKLGAGKVIMGWDEGIKGMQVGERRRLTIPAKLGYGSSGAGRIPPGATLIFEVELMEIR